MNPVRVGIIGTRFGAVVHLPAFRAAAGCSVVGIAGQDPKRTKEVAAKEDLRAFDSWKELLADPAIDAISIAAPPTLHKDIILAAADARKHVLCEKPFCMSADEATEAKQAMEKAGLVHMIDFEFRDHPVFQRAKQWLDEGRGGEVRHVELRWCVGSWADPGRPWQWQCDESLGGGILGALAVHAFDYIEWLFGPIAHISAQAGIAIPSRKDRDGTIRPCTAPDHVHILLGMKTGLPVTCTVSNVTPHGTGHRIEIHGSARSLLVESTFVEDYGKGFSLQEGSLQSRDLIDRTPKESPDSYPGDGRVIMMLPLIERFSGAIRGEREQMRPSFEAGVRSQTLMEAVRTAYTERRWIEAQSVDSASRGV